MSLLGIYPGMVGLKLEACIQYYYTVHQLLDQPLFLKKKKIKNPKPVTTTHVPHKTTRNIAQIANRSHAFNLCTTVLGTSLHPNRPLRLSKYPSTFFPANPVRQLHSPGSCTQKQPLQYTQFQPTLLAPRCKQYCFVCTFQGQ